MSLIDKEEDEKPIIQKVIMIDDKPEEKEDEVQVEEIVDDEPEEEGLRQRHVSSVD